MLLPGATTLSPVLVIIVRICQGFVEVSALLANLMFQIGVTLSWRLIHYFISRSSSTFILKCVLFQFFLDRGTLPIYNNGASPFIEHFFMIMY